MNQSSHQSPHDMLMSAFAFMVEQDMEDDEIMALELEELMEPTSYEEGSTVSLTEVGIWKETSKKPTIHPTTRITRAAKEPEG